MSSRSHRRPPATPPRGHCISESPGNCRHNPKRELWFAWWVMVDLLQCSTLVFFFVTRVQPPPEPRMGHSRRRSCAGSPNATSGIPAGFGVMFLISRHVRDRRTPSSRIRCGACR